MSGARLQNSKRAGMACRRRLFSTSSSRCGRPGSDVGSTRTILSGIQPTGIPHLGNYFGALVPWARLQNTARPTDRLLFFLADLHALTAPATPGAAAQLSRHRRQALAAVMAVGIGRHSANLSAARNDPFEASNRLTGAESPTEPSASPSALLSRTPKVSVFCQSQVGHHAELNWVLACQASVGYLGRMTQWKSKLARPTSTLDSQVGTDDAIDQLDADALLNPTLKTENKMVQTAMARSAAALRLGLFAYPVLQAADVLVHRATHVPVGPDQEQHLEFARQLATSFNAAVDKPVLVEPSTLVSRLGRSSSRDVTAAIKIRSLTEPTKKMSKSQGSEKSRVLITDDGGVIDRKVRSSVTDSIKGRLTYDPILRPGLANLIELLALVRRTDRSIANVDGDESGQAEYITDMAEFAASELSDTTTFRSLKEVVIKELTDHLEPVRNRFMFLTETESGKKQMSDEVSAGAQEGRRSAAVVMEDVWAALGIDSI